MPRIHDILPLLGQLNYTWTNTESLLIYLIAGLARTNKETAVVIFLTLNTTRARIDLVERLAKLSHVPEDWRDAVLAMTARMSVQSRLRNKYNHCIYSFDEEKGLANTQLMRIFDDAKQVKYGKVEMIDDKEIDRLKASITEITAVNDDIWKFVRAHDIPS